MADLLFFLAKGIREYPYYSEFALQNGLKLIVQKDTTIPYFSLQIFFKEGYGVEKENNNGIHRIWLAWLMRGPKGYSFVEFASKVEYLGGKYSWDIAPDYSSVSIEGPAKNFRELSELLIETLKNPAFSESDLEKVKKSLLAEISREKESPFDYTYNSLLESVYGKRGYGVNPLGDEKFVKEVSPERIKNFHEEFFGSQNMVVSLAGNIKISDLNFLKKKLLTIRKARRESLKPVCHYRRVKKNIKSDSPQTVVMIAVEAPSIRNINDYIATKILNAFTGKGMSSMLFVEAREKRSLGYEVASFFPTRKCGSLFVWYIKTTREKTEDATQLFKNLLKKLPEEITRDAVKRSATKEAGTFLLNHQSYSKRAWYLGWYESIGAGADFDRRYPELIKNSRFEKIIKQAKRIALQEPSIIILNP